jgi:hypothetical protein
MLQEFAYVTLTSILKGRIKGMQKEGIKFHSDAFGHKKGGGTTRDDNEEGKLNFPLAIFEHTGTCSTLEMKLHQTP